LDGFVARHTNFVTTGPLLGKSASYGLEVCNALAERGQPSCSRTSALLNLLHTSAQAPCLVLEPVYAFPFSRRRDVKVITRACQAPKTLFERFLGTRDFGTRGSGRVVVCGALPSVQSGCSSPHSPDLGLPVG
jgi:hypothetical protein